jgi:hypothetical protein
VEEAAANMKMGRDNVTGGIMRLSDIVAGGYGVEQICPYFRGI